MDADSLIRSAAFQRIRQLEIRFSDAIPWSAIQTGFELLNTQIHLSGRARGIFRPRQMQRGVLSIKTTMPAKEGNGAIMAKQPDRRRKYHLTVRPGTDLQGPSDEEIRSAVRKLPGKIPSFVVLQKRKCHFIQASGSFKKGFRLEYQEFSKDGHWEHVDSGKVDGDTVVRSLLWYAADDERWRTENQWRRYISPDDADDTDQPNEPDRPRKRDPLIRYIEGK